LCPKAAVSRQPSFSLSRRNQHGLDVQIFGFNAAALNGAAVASKSPVGERKGAKTVTTGEGKSLAFAMVFPASFNNEMRFQFSCAQVPIT